MNGEERFLSEMSSFKFLNERVLFRILFELFLPKELLILQCGRKYSLREIDGTFFMAIANQLGDCFKKENGTLSFYGPLYLSESWVGAGRKIINIDLLSRTFEHSQFSLKNYAEYVKQYEEKVCPFIKIITDRNEEHPNTLTVLNISQRREKSFELAKSYISLMQTRDFIKIQYESHMILINKHTFESINVKGYWCISEGYQPPNVFYSDITKTILQIDLNMATQITPYQFPGTIRGIISTQ